MTKKNKVMSIPIYRERHLANEMSVTYKYADARFLGLAFRHAQAILEMTISVFHPDSNLTCILML